MYITKRSKTNRTYLSTNHSFFCEVFSKLNSSTCTNINTGFVLYFQAQVANGNDYAHEHEHYDDQLIGESTCSFFFNFET